MKKTKLFFIVSVLLLVLVTSCAQTGDDAKAKKIIDYHKQKFNSLPFTGQVVDGVREVELKAYQYDWDPENIVVKKGEKVRITIESEDVPHGFEIEGMVIEGWDTDMLLKKGEKYEVEFTASDAGTWDVVCTGYCGPGHGAMKRKFIVRE